MNRTPINKQVQTYGSLEVQEAIIEERGQEMVRVQREMKEVNGLFGKVAALADIQGGRVKLAGGNINLAEENVAAGLENIKAADAHQKSGSTNTCLFAMFITCIAILGVGALVLYLTLPHHSDDPTPTPSPSP